jgi:hypothetical protein
MADSAWVKQGGPIRVLAWGTCCLLACAQETTPPQSAVSRAYDQLASAVASCATALGSCDEDDAGASEKSSCTEAFLACRTSAGREAERALVEALDECLADSQRCEREAEESGDAGEPENCSVKLRVCIGDSRLRSKSGAHAAASPDPQAPTYQCFGELRECVESDEAPQACSAGARECVIRAVGSPDASSQPPRPAPDAGPRDSGQPADSGRDAQPPARAGAPAPPTPMPEAGRGAMPPVPAGGGAKPGETVECMASYDACIAEGKKPMQCERDLRKCGKGR